MAVDTKDLGRFPIIDWPAPEFTIEDHTPTLRDQFAMAALTGVIRTCKADTLEPGQTMEQHFANKAYAVADAMLAAREAK